MGWVQTSARGLDWGPSRLDVVLEPVLGLPGWYAVAGYVTEVVEDALHYSIHPGYAVAVGSLWRRDRELHGPGPDLW